MHAGWRVLAVRFLVPARSLVLHVLGGPLGVRCSWRVAACVALFVIEAKKHLGVSVVVANLLCTDPSFFANIQ